jgi:peptide/nickel transport system permease protein
MVIFTARRVLAAVPTLLLIALLSFGLLYLIPGDPSVDIAGPNATPQDLADIRHQLGLDQSFLARLGEWFTGLIHLRLGNSMFTGAPVMDELRARLPVTLSLALVGLLFTVLIGLPFGLASGMRPNSLLDRLCTLGTSFGVAVPDFWIGLMLVVAFAINLKVFPAVGYVPLTDDPGQWLWHLILPGFTLSIMAISEFARQLRAGVHTVSQQPYVRTARSRGYSNARVNYKHILKNAMTAPLSIIGVQAARMLGGAIIIETIFGLPGVGSFALESVSRRDIPVVQGIVMIAGVMIILVNIVTDVGQALLDPQLRQQ